MRFLIHFVVMLAVALGIGFGLSWYALTDGRLFGTVQIGPWTAWRDEGTPNPDPYTRAHVVRTEGLELGASEGLQFVATTDSDNRRLDRDCSYRIDGRMPTARFWTLMPVALETGAPIAQPGGVLEFHSARLARAADGSAELYVSKSLRPRDWLEITGEGPFELLLTLYDSASLSGINNAALPAIIREGCA